MSWREEGGRAAWEEGRGSGDRPAPTPNPAFLTHPLLFGLDLLGVLGPDVLEYVLPAHEEFGRQGVAPLCVVDAHDLRLDPRVQLFLHLGRPDARGERVVARQPRGPVAVDAAAGNFEAMRTLAPPTARGWEALTDDQVWDWSAELAELPGLLAEKTKSPSVAAGVTDLVIDPTNLWLTIHESIGHATEYDRAIGYEAAYAGTSFATPDKLNRMRYGSEVMNITADRTVDHGLATIGYDAEGVAAQSWDLVRRGIFVGYQLDRVFARKLGLDRSNGCSYADSAHHVPIQRMPNVSLQPGTEDLSTGDLISRVTDGIYIVGDKSWSIDMQRYNFQFTGQRFFRIRNGRLDGQLRDVAYQAVTTDFWNSMEAVGGASTWRLGGAFNCGKAQPGQVAAVSHGCPSALFRGVNVLNTRAESGR